MMGRAPRKITVAFVIMIRSASSLLVAIVLSVWFAAPAYAGYAEGKAAFDDGDYETAYQEFQSLAERENINAQYYLGILYRNGWGVLQDDSEAARWLRYAAFQGQVEAQYTMGYMYQHGQGVTKDIVEAKRWYRMAARQGDADSQHNLNIISFEENSGPIIRRSNLGGDAMSDTPGNWFESALSLIIGLDDTLSVGDVLAITAIVLIIMIPLVMPFSFFRIKPLLIELSENAAKRDRALLDELQKVTPMLREIADASALRDQALLDEFRKLTGTIDEDSGEPENENP